MTKYSKVEVGGGEFGDFVFLNTDECRDELEADAADDAIGYGWDMVADASDPTSNKNISTPTPISQSASGETIQELSDEFIENWFESEGKHDSGNRIADGSAGPSDGQSCVGANPRNPSAQPKTEGKRKKKNKRNRKRDNTVIMTSDKEQLEQSLSESQCRKVKFEEAIENATQMQHTLAAYAVTSCGDYRPEAAVITNAEDIRISETRDNSDEAFLLLETDIFEVEDTKKDISNGLSSGMDQSSPENKEISTQGCSPTVACMVVEWHTNDDTVDGDDDGCSKPCSRCSDSDCSDDSWGDGGPDPIWEYAATNYIGGKCDLFDSRRRKRDAWLAYLFPCGCRKH